MDLKGEYKGKWWLPKKSKNKIDGTLTINRDGTSVLEIRKQLIKRNLFEFAQSSDNVDIILGRSSEGTKLTLLNCRLEGTSYSPEGFSTQSFKIETNILDAHYFSKDTITFRKLKVEFKHFEYLIKSTRIQIPEHSHITKNLTINNIASEEVPFFSTDNFKIEIVINVHGNLTIYPTRKIVVEETPYILIECDDERKYEDYLKIIDKLQRFFTFCVLKTVYPIKITGESAVNIWGKSPKAWIVSDDDQDINQVIYEQIQIISHWIDLPDPSQIDKVDQDEILFTLNEIQENFELIMSKWWIKTEVFKSIFDIYFGTIFNSKMFLQNTYLSLAQCIESYHRKSPRFLDYQIHPEEYKERIEIVKTSLKSQTQLTTNQIKSLINTLKMGNSLSLENRIQQLLITYPSISPIIVGNVNNFPNTIILNRNNLTHLDPKPDIKYATFEELYDLSIRMRLLLITIILDELGFENKKIEKIIGRLARSNRLQ